MTMDLRNKVISLTAEKNLTVCEADASYDARMAQLVTVADKAESTDKTFLFFYRTYYPVLAACSRGEVPSPQEAYELPADKLDVWYRAIWEMNPEILGEYKPEHKQETVTFRDGSEIVLHETQDLPSFTLKIVGMENEALARTDIAAEHLSLITMFYPRMAGCANGSIVPSESDFLTFPKSEFTKWLAAANRVNPSLFKFMFDASAEASPETDVIDVKKKRKRRIHHKPALSASKKGDTGTPGPKSDHPRTGK